MNNACGCNLVSGPEFKDGDCLICWRAQYAPAEVRVVRRSTGQDPFEGPLPPIFERRSTFGVGTQLERYIGWISRLFGSCCDCESLRDKLDALGIQWCEDNIDEVLAMLKLNAKSLGIPYSKFVARRLVWRAIKRAKRLKDREHK